MPLISVIIPVYNAELTLERCVNSVLEQQFKDFELILIDDGSTDQSPHICDTLSASDDRVKVIHKPNGGVSSARNVGLKHAEGTWITFIDADDGISGNFLSCFAKEDVYFCNLSFTTNEGKQENLYIESKTYFTMSSLVQRYILSTVIRGPVAKFFKKDLMSSLTFPEDMKVGEDAYFVFRYLARCNSFGILESGFYNVRVADKPDEIKYALAVDYAVNSLLHLKDAFDELDKAHHIGKDKFLYYIGYFKRVSKGEWGKDKALWYKNPEIRGLYQYVWSDLCFIRKIRVLISFILKK